MASLVDLHPGEVVERFNIAILVGILARANLERLGLRGIKLLVAVPVKVVDPSLVTQPVADEISIAGINKYRNLFQQLRDDSEDGLHPVTSEHEITIDLPVAAFIAMDFNSKSLDSLWLIQPLRNPCKGLITQVVAILALHTDVIRVETSLLVGQDERIVAVNGCRNALPGALRVITSLDKLLTPLKRVIHRFAVLLTQNGRVTAITTSHWAVVSILSILICQAIADKNALEIDVAILVGENFRSKGRNVMSAVGLACDVEVLLGIFRELMEE